MSSLGRAPRTAHQITRPPDAAKTSPLDKELMLTLSKNHKPQPRGPQAGGSGAAESHETAIWAGTPRRLAADIAALSEEAFHCSAAQR